MKYFNDTLDSLKEDRTCVFVAFYLKESILLPSLSEKETEMSAVLINILQLFYEDTDVFRGRCAAGRW